MKKFRLDRNERGVSHFLNLKKDFENDKPRLFISLPLFVRIMFHDKPNPWVNEINRFGFIQLLAVNQDFGFLDSGADPKLKWCSKIFPTRLERKEVDVSEFLETVVVAIENQKYTMLDFIFGLAYNGGIHMMPSKENYELIYRRMFEHYPEAVTVIVDQVARIFINVFQELYDLLDGDNNGHSLNHGFQPMAAKDGKMLDGAYFRRSYMQFPIRAKNGMGIRLCLEIKLIPEVKMKNRVILEYGHQSCADLKVRIFQNHLYLLLEVCSKGRVKLLKTLLNGDIFNKFTQIEVAVYSTGKIVLAMDRLTRAVDDIQVRTEIINGKVILGSNLIGTEFGEFYYKTLVVQSIDRLDNMRALGAYSFQRLKLNLQNIDYKQIQREFI